MRWEKVKISKIFFSLILAGGLAVFIGEKVFFPGTMVINPTFSNMIKRPGPQYNSPYSPATAAPVPQTSSFPYQPAPTSTLPPTGGQTPNPTSTPIPTATPIVPTPTISSATVETFAKCLTQRGMKMYGVDTCGNCQYQKSLFGSAFSYINYINCGPQAQVCVNKGIGGYPTWEDVSGNLHPGAQSLPSLSQISGCPAPS